MTLSKDNTAKLIELQVPEQGISSGMLNLAFSELAINGELAEGRITNTSAIDVQLANVSSKLSAYSTSPISLVELARYVDAPFIMALAPSLNLSYATAVSLAPLLGSMLPLLVGIIVLVLFMALRSYLQGKRKLVRNTRTAGNWRRIYLFIIVLTVLWMIATYVLLSYANSSAPFGAFAGAYSSSKYLAIAINGTPTAATLSCAGTLKAQAASLNKTAVLVTFSNGQCSTVNGTKSVDACLGSYASSGTPVVVLGENTRNAMSLYSLYGTVLGASGNDTIMNLCYVSLLT